ncbi:MAG: hypothetical protein LBI66_07655 [Burkholderiaceae bacterium]|nr:hypothetical protein [Burkholderiaceae bacterium]
MKTSFRIVKKENAALRQIFSIREIGFHIEKNLYKYLILLMKNLVLYKTQEMWCAAAALKFDPKADARKPLVSTTSRRATCPNP